MLKITSEDVSRWTVELSNAEKFRRDTFGEYSDKEVVGSGENIQYFEFGVCGIRSGAGYAYANDEKLPATLNIIFPIVKNIVPTLYFKNPKILASPKRKEDEASAPMAAELLNYYHGELNIKEQIQLSIFDALVVGMGVVKTGYATQFGADIPDDEEEKRREKSKFQKIKEALGFSKPKEEEKKENIELNEFIRTESPYVVWVSPFDFLIDPLAKSIHDAKWVAHRVKKTLAEVKSNKNYKNTSTLQPSEIEKTPEMREASEAVLENFQTVDLYEIHYKTDEGINILVLAKDQLSYKPLRHEKSPYEMDGFQFEVLTLNKHGHRLYPRSDISIVKALHDRIVDSFDAVLEQVDRFQTKILYDENKLTPQGQKSMRDGGLGALVACNSSPAEAVKEVSLTQVKSDMMVLIERLIDIISLETGLTRAQLTGITSAETATEANIGQAGQNLRRSDQAEAVIEFVNRINRKLWQVIAQFVNLEEVQIITGEPMMTPTGELQYNWLTVSPDMADNLNKGEYSFDIETGSSQRPNVEVMRQQATNFTNMLFNPVVRNQLRAEGKDIDLGEVLRTALKLFPEWIKNTNRIIKQATPQQQMQAQMQEQGPSNRGQSPENTGATPNMPRTPPTPTSMIEEVMGERRGGM